jgi:hypothetical protein
MIFKIIISNHTINSELKSKKDMERGDGFFFFFFGVLVLDKASKVRSKNICLIRFSFVVSF